MGGVARRTLQVSSREAVRAPGNDPRTTTSGFSFAKSGRRAGVRRASGRTITRVVRLPTSSSRPFAAATALLALAAASPAAAWKSLPAHANVQWAVADSVAVCPAGDSVAAGHPARLRVALRYSGGLPLEPRVGVPPDSLLLILEPLPGPGAVVVHDLAIAGGASRLFADDSTNAAGEARFTVASLSGSGRLALTVMIAGETVAGDTATVRGVDADGDGRVSGADPVLDLDYGGAVDGADLALAAPHSGHGHRGALHGTLVRRTDLCATCLPETEGTLGESGASWSPDGRELAFTRFTGPLADCAVHRVPSDPREGNEMIPFTFPPPGVHDYDPDWSPFGTEIAFDRGDSACFRKGVPGLNPDTTLHLITHFDDGTPSHIGDITPAISPDGRWVAFSRKSPEGYWHLWKIPIEGVEGGATAIQLTSILYASDMYPRWSPDGEWLYVDRQNGFDGQRRIYRIRASGGAEDSLLAPLGGFEAVTPGLSPDGVVVAAGVGTHTRSSPRAIEAALPPQSTLAQAIPAFPGVELREDFPLPVPRFSPDGTRLALRAPPADRPDERPQIWSTRRNMSLPPVIHTVAALPVPPATPFVDLEAAPGTPLAFSASASDPEGDPLKWAAYFLRPDLGMSFDPGSASFSWTPPPGSAGQTFTLRLQVTTPSGGTAYALARLHVAGPAAVGAGTGARLTLAPAFPNPCTRAATLRFSLPAAARARLEILDLEGRCVAIVLEGPLEAGAHQARWSPDPRVPPGLYFCRLTAGTQRATRKIVLAR